MLPRTGSDEGHRYLVLVTLAEAKKPHADSACFYVATISSLVLLALGIQVPSQKVLESLGW